ncbi:MAG: DUF1573 domain-containing protein [Cytophagales bacterium]|nr:DUF1573 domain-containing protein [Cytophagales bacterium]MDW8384619.1 DUF1573 domain-containing protein [Flammeovirgaceae bacterium]
MKQRLVIITILFLGLFWKALAQSSNNPPTALQGSKIEFIKSEHDFGDIYQGDVVSYVFTFKNTGNMPLILTNVQTTCGCTAPSWTREPVLPGKTGEINIQFNSSGKSGIQNKVITVFSNAVNPQARLRIQANVLPRP